MEWGTVGKAPVDEGPVGGVEGGVVEGAAVGVVLEECAIEWGASLPCGCSPLVARVPQLFGGLGGMLWISGSPSQGFLM